MTKRETENKLTKVTKGNGGFTLVELIVVIAILGIIAAIAVPNLIGNINTSRKQTDVNNAKAIANSIVQVVATNNEYGEKEISGKWSNDSVALFAEAHDLLQDGINITPQFDGEEFFVSLEDGQVTVTIDTAGGTELFPSVDPDYQ